MSWAIEQTDSAVILTDASDRVTYVNAAFERMWARSRTEVVGHPVSMLYSGHHPLEFWEGIRRRNEAGDSWTGTIIDRRADGTIFEVESVMTPMRDESGRIVGRVEVARDMSRERALEAQLRQAQKMEAVGRLAGGVAHDFNNILTAIDGFAQLVVDELPPGGARSDVEEIRRNAQRAAALTRQLLAFSRRQVLRPAIVDPSEVVESVIPMLRRILGEDVELDWKPTSRHRRVVVDPSQLEQVVVNLAVNARDAMPAGGRLEISTAAVDIDGTSAPEHLGVAPGSYVALVVADTGTGMSEEVKAHVFEPFFTTKPVGVGTGLGLATVDGIVAQSGGHITFDSQPGRGTTFRIYLPSVDDGGERVAALASRPDREPLPALRVLLVEDEDAVRAFATRVLEQHGLRVTAAATPAEALVVAGGEPVDLLISDVVMPGMTGPELADALRSTHPGMVVLHMSGYVEQSLSQRGIGRPGDAFLPKPFAADDLIDAIHEALAAGTPTADARGGADAPLEPGFGSPP